MKTNNLFRLTLVAASLAFMFACQKSNQSSSGGTTSASDVQTASDDQTMVTNQDEATDNDAELALNSSTTIAGSSLHSLPTSGNSTLGLGILGLTFCGDSLSYDTANGMRSLTITYDGLDCIGKNTRTGTITISVPQGEHWKDAGTTVTLSVNLTITRKADGKSIIIKGTKTITNTSGGLLIDLATISPIVHEISANWSITFPNGSTRTWTVTKHRVFTYNDGAVITTTNGIGSNTAISGTNRFGVAFTSSITQPKVFLQSCNFNLVSGQDSLTRGDKITAILTYGLDASGNPVSGCPSSGFYAELVWTNNVSGKTYTYIYPY